MFITVRRSTKQIKTEQEAKQEVKNNSFVKIKDMIEETELKDFDIMQVNGVSYLYMNGKMKEI